MGTWLRDVPTDEERAAGWRGKFVLKDKDREYEIVVGEVRGVPVTVVIGNDCTPAKFYGHVSESGSPSRDYWYGAEHVLDDIVSTTHGLPRQVVDRVWDMRYRIKSCKIPRQDPPSQDKSDKQ
jgi:hypothetical protein